MTNRPPPSPYSLRGTLGSIVIVAGVVALGAYALDLHSHACESCGHRWRHLGAFNIGDERSHTCARCGQVQWWKDGVPQVVRNAHARLHATHTTNVVQELRDTLRRALPSGRPQETPR